MNGLVQGTRPCTFGCISGDSPSLSESGAGPESGFGSPASPVWWDLGAKSLTVTGIIIIIFIFKNFYNKQYIQYNIF